MCKKVHRAIAANPKRGATPPNVFRSGTLPDEKAPYKNIFPNIRFTDIWFPKIIGKT